MQLAYDPGDGTGFWDAISQLPGYPSGEIAPIPVMLFESGALYRLPEVIRTAAGGTDAPVVVVMDETPMQRGAELLKPLVIEVLRGAGLQAEVLWMKPDATGQVHTDMPHIELVKASLRPGLAVLAVGSGVVTDISKHAAYLYQQESGEKLPFVVYQTANSVSAFTSNMAPVFVGGVKRTLNSRYPDALVCDLETLRDAPAEMTVAGVGDLLAYYVSIPDWFMAHQLGMDSSYSLLPQSLCGPMDELLLEQAENIRTGDLAGVSLLAKLISLSGLSMSLSHATTPFSGYEHVMSHVLDMQAEVAGLPLAQHGTQVVLNTVIATEVYRRFLEEFEPAEVNPARCYPTFEQMQSVVSQAFLQIDPTGNTSAECWADYRQKLEKWDAHKADLQTFLATWPEIKPQVQALTCSPERIHQILQAIDSPRLFATLTPPLEEEQVKFAFFNAPLMRKRLTIGDLLIYFQWDREQLWRDAWQRSQALGSTTMAETL